MNLQKIRKDKKISQQKLADSINVSRSTVAMWETGASQPDNNALIKLSEYLNVSIDLLLANDKDFDLSNEQYIIVSSEEYAIIEKLRKLDPAKRAAIETLLGGL